MAKTPKERILSRIKRAGDCWEWQGARKPSGYGTLTKGSRKEDRKTITAHRYSYEAFVGPIPDGAWVLHKCDNRSCCNPEHLYLGDREQNVKDREERGRNKLPLLRGENHPAAKLTAREVMSIRRMYSGAWGEIQIIANIYGVHRRTISDIVRWKKWKHLKEAPK